MFLSVPPPFPKTTTKLGCKCKSLFADQSFLNTLENLKAQISGTCDESTCEVACKADTNIKATLQCPGDRVAFDLTNLATQLQMCSFTNLHCGPWGEWTLKGACSATCGPAGLQDYERTRSKFMPTPTNPFSLYQKGKTKMHRKRRRRRRGVEEEVLFQRSKRHLGERLGEENKYDASGALLQKGLLASRIDNVLSARRAGTTLKTQPAGGGTTPKSPPLGKHECKDPRWPYPDRCVVAGMGPGSRRAGGCGRLGAQLVRSHPEGVAARSVGERTGVLAGTQPYAVTLGVWWGVAGAVGTPYWPTG